MRSSTVIPTSQNHFLRPSCSCSAPHSADKSWLMFTLAGSGERSEEFSPGRSVFLTRTPICEFYDAPQEITVSSEMLLQAADPRIEIRWLKQALRQNHSVRCRLSSNTCRECQAWLSGVFSRYGLHPQFESEDYWELKELKNHGVRPLILIVSTEDAALGPTGGIGSFVSNLKESLGSHLAILTLGTLTTPRDPTFHLSIGELYPGFQAGDLERPAVVYDGVMELLARFPSIHTIVGQDYREANFRLVQARTSGQLPEDVRVATFLHGNDDYLALGSGRLGLFQDLKQAKASLKQAAMLKGSSVVFHPSKYIKDLYEGLGYELPRETVRIPMPLPRHKAATPEDGNVKQIVYVGKFSEFKGWHLFVEAMSRLAELTHSSQTEIKVFAPGVPPEKDIKKLRGLFQQVSIENPENGVLLTNLNSPTRKVIVVPHFYDNFPLAVLEALATNHATVTAATGGAVEVAELMRAPNTFLSGPSGSELAEAITKALVTKALTNSEIRTHRARVNRIRKRSDAKLLDALLNWKYDGQLSGIDWRGISVAYSAVTPWFRNSISELQRAYESILSQTLMPTEWIIVSDGNPRDANESIIQWVEGLDSSFTIRLVFHESNLGLVRAKQTGMLSAVENFVQILDADDALAPRVTHLALRALISSPETAAVGGGLVWKRPDGGSGSWYPLGTEFAHLLDGVENHFISASSMLRKDAFEQTHPFPLSTNSMLEDWALYSQLSRLGWHIQYLQVDYLLYGISSNQMTKTAQERGGPPNLLSAQTAAETYARRFHLSRHLWKSGGTPLTEDQRPSEFASVRKLDQFLQTLKGENRDRYEFFRSIARKLRLV